MRPVSNFLIMQLSNSRAEHGLGLKLVKQIVRAHKGTIQFSDSVPHGLTVQISLPGGK